jgi:hypothetical protein
VAAPETRRIDEFHKVLKSNNRNFSKVLLIGKTDNFCSSLNKCNLDFTTYNPTYDIESISIECLINDHFYDLILYESPYAEVDQDSNFLKSFSRMLSPDGICLGRHACWKAQLSEEKEFVSPYCNRILGSKNFAFVLLAFQRGAYSLNNSISLGQTFKNYAERKCETIASDKKQIWNLTNHIDNCLNKKIEILEKKLNIDGETEEFINKAISFSRKHPKAFNMMLKAYKLLLR